MKEPEGDKVETHVSDNAEEKKEQLTERLMNIIDSKKRDQN